MSTRKASVANRIAACVPVLRGVAFVLTGCRDSADDLIEKVIMRMFTTPAGVRSDGPPRLRMLTILHELYYTGEDRRRGTIQSTWKMRESASIMLPVRHNSSPVFRDFDHAFWHLCDYERELLFLKEVNDLSGAEIAQICGCTSTTIDVRLSHAHWKLARLLYGNLHSGARRAKTRSVRNPVFMKFACSSS